MRLVATLSLGAVLVSGLALGAPLTASADTSDFEFASLDADYTLSQDAHGVATLQTVETFVADFPSTDQNRGIVREIPRYHLGADTQPTVQSVTDEHGTPVPFDASENGDDLELALGTDEFVHGATTYVISYTQRYVVGHYEDTDDDEFYWDVNGTGWQQPFGRITATVHVAPSIAADLTGHTACYQGAFQSTARCTLSTAEDGDGQSFTVTEKNVAAKHNVTVVIGFTSGAFVQGEVTQTSALPTPAWVTITAGVLVVVAVLLLVLAIVVRIRRRLAAPRAGFIVPQYSVPDGLEVMVAANLVDRPATAVPAALVSLAVRGKLRILDYPVTQSGADYTLQYLDDEGLDPLETRLMHALFGTSFEKGEVKELSPHDAALGRAVAAIATDATTEVVSSGLAERRGTGCLLPALGALPVAGSFLLVFVGSAVGGFPGLAFAAAFVTVALLIATAIVSFTGRRVRTVEGQRLHDYLEGMKLYLTVAEKERMRVLQSPQGAERIDVGDTHAIIKLYEKLLPFAVIWGVEDQWSKELEIKSAQVQQNPDWFVSQSAFNALAFTSTLHGVSSAATYVPSSAGTGSGSSFPSFGGGSMGGGFSGGGGGGGGGGGR